MIGRIKSFVKDKLFAADCYPFRSTFHIRLRGTLE
jgi:hypothetical protein